MPPSVSWSRTWTPCASKPAKFQVSDDSYYIKWAEPSRLFHAQYLDEQLRKAALFPQTSSEVDRFGDYERNGDDDA